MGRGWPEVANHTVFIGPIGVFGVLKATWNADGGAGRTSCRWGWLEVANHTLFIDPIGVGIVPPGS